MHKPFAFVALAAALAGCGYSEQPVKSPEYAGQSYPEAVRVLCDVDRLAGINAEDDPLAAGRQRTEFIQSHVENPDGIYFRTMISVKGASEQAADLRAEAKEAGLSGCALADDLEKNGAGGIAP